MSHAISVLIVTWNSAATIEACLASLPADVDVIVVDNHSSDGTAAHVRQAFPAVRVLESATNLGFGAACNWAAREASGSYFLLLNPDAALAPGALEGLLASLERLPGGAAVGPRLLDADGGLELSWGESPTPRTEWRRRAEQLGKRSPSPPRGLSSVDWISGACILIRADAWKAIGGFDEGYFLYFEDVDLCRRLTDAGWTIGYEPEHHVTHLRGRSSDQASAQVEVWYRMGQLRYYAKHNSWLQRLMLRAHLFVKYAIRALRGDPAGGRVLKLALGVPSPFRVP